MGDTWLRKLKDRYGYAWYYHAFWNQNVLRYLRAPHLVLNILYFGRTKDMNRGGRYPVSQYPSSTGASYQMVRGFLPKLPRIIIEDLILFGMTLLLIFKYMDKTLSSATIVSLLLAFMNLGKMLLELRSYVRAVRKYHRTLIMEKHHNIEGADGALAQLMSHPVRRVLTCCNRRRLDNCVSPV